MPSKYPLASASDLHSGSWLWTMQCSNLHGPLLKPDVGKHQEKLHPTLSICSEAIAEREKEREKGRLNEKEKEEESTRIT